MPTSPALLVTLASTLLLGGLTQPVVTTSACPPQITVSPEDAVQAEAVVRDLIAAVSIAAAPGADARTVTAAEAAVDGLMVSFNAPPGAPPQALAEVGYWGLPRPSAASTPLTVGEPLELYGAGPMDGLDQIVLTAEVSNSRETRTTQFVLLREEGEWRVLAILPATLDPAGCYVPPAEVIFSPGGAEVAEPPVVTGDPVVVAGSPVTAGEGDLPADAPPLGDPGGEFPAEPTGPIGIHVVNADGSDLANLLPTGGLPAWSPDGTRIAFSSFDPAHPEAGPDIAVMQADGSQQTAVTDGPGWDEAPAWSPDGTRLAFLRVDWNAASSELYVANADGSGLTKLAEAAQPCCSPFPSPPAWSPDGRTIAFTGPGGSGDTGGRGAALASDVWVVGADGSDLSPVTDVPGEVSGPTWSPDGTRLAFAQTVFGTVGPSSNALYVVNPDSTELTALTGWAPPQGLDPNSTRPDPPEPESTAIQSTPMWSPDGRSLVFASIWGLAVIGADGAGLTVHPVDELQVLDPVWSPDGSRIAFSGSSFEAYEDIYVVHPDGSGLTRVAGTEMIDGAIAWSPDGTKLAFTASLPSGD